MKPLLINTTLSGGAARACIRLHQGLLQQHVDSQLLTLQNGSQVFQNQTRYPQSGLAQYYNFLQDVKQKIAVKVAGVEAYEFIRSPYRIHELDLYHQSDVINFHWTNRFLDYPSFFTNNTKPVIWTLHDMQAFSGGNAYLSEISQRFFKQRTRKNIQEKKGLLKDQNIHIVCLSNWMMNHSKNSEVFGSFPHYLIPNGIDTTIYKSMDKAACKMKLAVDPEKKLILFVSQSVDHIRKGFQYLLEAFQHPDMTNIELLAVGDVSASSKANIKSTGYISDEEKLAEIYCAADLFVIPSIEDNLPNTVVESLCCGTPVVGFDIGGIPDMIIDGQNGFLASNLTAECLRNQVLQALSKNWNTASISQNAHEKYALGVQSSRYIELFHRSLD